MRLLIKNIRPVLETRKPNQSNPASNPLISVIIPLYNKEKYIGEALESLFAQTYEPFEVIVVDDGSTDSSLSVVRKYPDVKVISQVNQGAAIARNNGAALSKGDFLAFLDADDLWDKQMLEKQMNVFFSYPDLSIVTNLFQQVSEDGKELKADLKIKISFDIPFNPYALLLSEGNPINMSGAIIKKSNFVSVGGFRAMHIGEDYDLWIRLAAKENLFYIVSEKLTKYRMCPDSLIRGSIENEYNAELEVLERNNPRYNRIALNKRKSKIYYNWADTALYSRDSTVWFATFKSIYYNPFNYKIYLLVIHGLIKKMITC